MVVLKVILRLYVLGVALAGTLTVTEPSPGMMTCDWPRNLVVLGAGPIAIAAEYGLVQVMVPPGVASVSPQTLVLPDCNWAEVDCS
jgi:hypothetical protein